MKRCIVSASITIVYLHLHFRSVYHFCDRMFITTQDIVNFRNPTAEVLPVEKDFTDKSKCTVKVNLMDLNFCSPTMSSFDPCLAEICKLK